MFPACLRLGCKICLGEAWTHPGLVAREPEARENAPAGGACTCAYAPCHAFLVTPFASVWVTRLGGQMPEQARCQLCACHPDNQEAARPMDWPAGQMQLGGACQNSPKAQKGLLFCTTGKKQTFREKLSAGGVGHENPQPICPCQISQPTPAGKPHRL